MKKILTGAVAITSTLASVAALAHPNHESLSIGAGLLSGALHPLMGLDHLLALCAVGALSAPLQGLQKWLVPSVFAVLMALGFVLAHGGWHLAVVSTMETMIMLSLLMGGVLLVVNRLACRYFSEGAGILRGFSAWAMTGFALFHGMAHGLEVPLEASAVGFGMSFVMVSLAVMVIVISARLIIDLVGTTKAQR